MKSVVLCHLILVLVPKDKEVFVLSSKIFSKRKIILLVRSLSIYSCNKTNNQMVPIKLKQVHLKYLKQTVHELWLWASFYWSNISYNFNAFPYNDVTLSILIFIYPWLCMIIDVFSAAILYPLNHLPSADRDQISFHKMDLGWLDY